LRKDIHAKTATFGKKRDVSKAMQANPDNENHLRVHLSADIRELRGLLKNAEYDASIVSLQLTELIKQLAVLLNEP